VSRRDPPSPLRGGAKGTISRTRPWCGRFLKRRSRRTSSLSRRPQGGKQSLVAAGDVLPPSHGERAARHVAGAPRRQRRAPPGSGRGVQPTRPSHRPAPPAPPRRPPQFSGTRWRPVHQRHASARGAPGPDAAGSGRSPPTSRRVGAWLIDDGLRWSVRGGCDALLLEGGAQRLLSVSR
jgi:hypothetical protein